MTGTNAIAFYSNIIFAKTGVNSTTGTAIVGTATVVATFICIFLLAIWGRKTLFWVGDIGMAASLITFGFLYLYGD